MPLQRAPTPACFPGGGQREEHSVAGNAAAACSGELAYVCHLVTVFICF